MLIRHSAPKNSYIIIICYYQTVINTCFYGLFCYKLFINLFLSFTDINENWGHVWGHVLDCHNSMPPISKHNSATYQGADS